MHGQTLQMCLCLSDLFLFFYFYVEIKVYDEVYDDVCCIETSVCVWQQKKPLVAIFQRGAILFMVI